MTTLSPDQLQALTDAINERIAQEYAKWQFNNPPRLVVGAVEAAYEVIERFVVEPVSEEPTPIRIGSEVFGEVGTRGSPADGYIPPLIHGNADVGAALCQRDPQPEEPTISDNARAVLGPEHVVVTPLEPVTVTGRTLAEADADARIAAKMAVVANEVADLRMSKDEKATAQAVSPDDELAALRMDKDQKAAQFRDILAELQMMAKNGIMPSQNEWNIKKPAHLPLHGTILSRFDLSGWGELAKRARLKYLGKGYKAGRAGRGGTPDAADSNTGA
jgi:hypothetical protein